MRILITGANRGIGAQMAAQLAARGNDVIATSRDGSTGAALDVTDQSSIAALSGKVGPIDMLVCNAGVFVDRGEPLNDGYAPDLWAQTFAANVTGVFSCIQGFKRNLEAGNTRKIAVIASQMGSSERASGNGGFIYRASKAAAINLTTNMALALKPEGFAMGAYHPGWVRTDMGGSAADIDATTSAAGLIACFDKLGPDHTGVFENYDGTPLPY